MNNKPKKTETIAFTVTNEQKEAIVKLAEMDGRTVSDYVRRRVLLDILEGTNNETGSET